MINILKIFIGSEQLPNLMIALNPISVKWYIFGTFLGLSVPTLDAIEEENGRKIDKCNIVMLQKWLQASNDTTKHQLYNCLLKYKRFDSTIDVRAMIWLTYSNSCMIPAVIFKFDLPHI